jgi:N-acetylmuramoyl-L-alanine amidase
MNARLNALLLAALAALALAVLPARAQVGLDQSAAFRQALAEFQAVSSSEQKAAVRDNWSRVLAYFRETLNQDPNSELAAKSLYYMGRVYQELGLRSFLHTDFSQAADFFQRAVNRFPANHSWVDDCLYRKAEISAHRLDSVESAKADLKALLTRFPDGDQADNARKLLAELSRSAAPEASRTGGPHAQAKAGVNTAYYAAVKQFKALGGKKTSRDQFLRSSREFEEIAGRDPDGPFAGRALYYAASAAEEAGDAGRKADDLRRAADLFGRAARSFAPKDSWVDDCLMRRAKLLVRLGNSDLAYGDLLQIVHEFPKGDQAEAAKAMLRSMDEARAGTKALATPKAPEPSPASPVAETPAAAPAAGAGAATLTDVRYFTSDDYTRIVLDMDRPAAYEHHPLPPDPAHQKSHRMYLDLKDTRLSAQASRVQDIPASFLQSVRAGQYDPTTTRVVLDFQELKQYHVFALDNPYRIVIDVYASGKGAAAAKPEAEPEKPKAAAQDKPKAKESDKKAAAKPAPEPVPGEKNKKVAGDVLAQLGMTIETVLIDAGHGGKDPGAIAKVKSGGGYVEVMEKNVTLHMAKILGALLQSKGYKVMYTREDDRYVSLEDRSVMGNLKKADLFISLHVNANNDDDVRGLETYFLGKARKDKELRLAAYENNVDPVKISDTQKIVLDLVHSFKIEESKVLADHVQKRTVRDLRAKWDGVNDHGARPAPFFVLIGAKMPSILVEIGYLTNPAEAPRLLDEHYLKSLADGILDGIESYKRGLKVAGMGALGG